MHLFNKLRPQLATVRRKTGERVLFRSPSDLRTVLRNIDPRLQLPVEVVLIIFDQIDDLDVLALLCRVSRTFYTLGTSRLYERVAIDSTGAEWNRYKVTMKTISIPTISSLVVDLSVALMSWNSYRDGTCRPAWLSALEAALLTLHSLERLHILCQYKIGRNSRWTCLAHLPTRRLKVLRLACACSQGVEEDLVILSAPCMQTVTSLQWPFSKLSGPETTPMDILPDLTTVWYNDIYDFGRRVTNRQISRIGGQWMSDACCLHIEEIASHLTHINIEDSGHDEILLGIVKLSPKLQHLGRLYFSEGTVSGEQIIRVSELIADRCHICFRDSSHFNSYHP